MTDLEIYDLASNVITSITRDLSAGIYTDLGGSLKQSWCDKKQVIAWAESLEPPTAPPDHRVVISYELARQFYRDAEDYHQFAANELLGDRFQTIFKDFDPKPQLANHITRNVSVRHMFIGSLTWVFFHELGHLMQEHGYIRERFGGGESVARIEDCELDGGRRLEGHAAAISHVTEIAADIEATQYCVSELIRHFLPDEMTITDDEHSRLEFRSNLYLLVCGISCAFYRFYGQRPVGPEPVVHGSHPTPIRRLEVCLPNIFEKLDDAGRGEQYHGLNRHQLVHLCLGAAYSAQFFWLGKGAMELGMANNFMLKGIPQDPFKKNYWTPIVDAWDEIEPTIREVRRFGIKAGILSFTETFRSQILE